MGGLSLLERARSAGLQVSAEGGRLVVRGPRRAEPVARELLAHKVDVVRLLTCSGLEAEDAACMPNEAAPQTAQFPFAVRWSRERGWLEVRDSFTGAWHEVPAEQCPPHWRRWATAVARGK